MNKLKITVEQEEALKFYKKAGGKDEPIKNQLEEFTNRKFSYTQSFKSLDKFTPEQFALLLCGWYEVEQPFKVGDWVYDKFTKHYRKLISGESYEIRKMPIQVAEKNFNNDIEKVTEPWKIMLLELGREKPEFKVGDKYDTHIPLTIMFEDQKKDAERFANEGKIKHFYPVESRIEVKHENN